MAIVDQKELYGGTQVVHRFENGYGASVIQHDFSYGGKEGLWELAVLDFSGDDEGALTYATEITDDVLGHLTEEDVEDLLAQIEELEKY